MNRWILGLVVCASNLISKGLAAAQEAKAGENAAVKEASRPEDPSKAEITFVIHGYDRVIGALGFDSLKAELEKRGYACKAVRSPKSDRPNEDRAKAVVEALKNVEGKFRRVGHAHDNCHSLLISLGN